jgi:acetoin utilization deacetylase AcuC-like enzyme
VLRTALLIDRRYTEHVIAPGHPESPARMEALLPLAGDPGREGVVPLAPRAASREEILRVHTEAHFERVRRTAGAAHTFFDADTSAGARTFEIALLAAGGFLEVLDAIADGRCENGFALVRPPGHHAESERVMGFCFFNNVAVGAEHLRRRGFRRILIVDWDVHHGNGTQEIYLAEPEVFVVSFHEHPCYPGTGRAEERGVGAGLGRTLNVPLPPGSGDAEFLAAYDRLVEPAAREFAPDFVLVSAGFDAHREDPLASMTMTEQGYAALTGRLLALAHDCCGDRLALVLEGGYDLEALAASVKAVLLALRGAGAGARKPAAKGARP